MKNRIAFVTLLGALTAAGNFIFTNCAPTTFRSNSNLLAVEEGDVRELKLLDGDMVIDAADLSARDLDSLNVDGQVVTTKAGRDLTDVKASYWKNGLIPIKFESGFTSSQKKMVWDACAKWSAGAKVDCVPYQSAVHGTNYLYVTKTGDGCYANFGKPNSGYGLMNLGEHQDVTYSLPQGTCFMPGIAMHELGHVLGMVHEHSRPDRDSYIVVKTANLKSTCVDAFTFKYLSSDIVKMGSTYDFKSIMHYSKQHCSANGKETLVPLAKYDLGTYELGDSVLKTATLTSADKSFASQVYGAR